MTVCVTRAYTFTCIMCDLTGSETKQRRAHTFQGCDVVKVGLGSGEEEGGQSWRGSWTGKLGQKDQL